MISFKTNNWQINLLVTLSKVFLLPVLSMNSTTSISLGVYHFILLYTTLTFIVVGCFEFFKQNYILAAIAVLAIIIYQPFLSVLKNDYYGGEVYVYSEVMGITFIITSLWIILDIGRWIRNYRRFKKVNI